MRRIRLPDRPRPLWTDSLCIDQDNLEEKGHQVAFMGRIYRQSNRTFIVIGADDCGHRAPTAALLKEVDENIFTKVRPDWDTLPFFEHDHPLMDDPRLSSLHNLLGTAWFERGWVVQEAAFAQDGQVIWGDHESFCARFMRVYI